MCMSHTTKSGASYPLHSLLALAGVTSANASNQILPLLQLQGSDVPLLTPILQFTYHLYPPHSNGSMRSLCRKITLDAGPRPPPAPPPVAAFGNPLSSWSNEAIIARHISRIPAPPLSRRQSIACTRTKYRRGNTNAYSRRRRRV